MITIVLQHGENGTLHIEKRVDEETILDADAVRYDGKLFAYSGPVAGRHRFREVVKIVDLD